MPTDVEVAKAAIEDFRKIQKYMIIVKGTKSIKAVPFIMILESRRPTQLYFA